MKIRIKYLKINQNVIKYVKIKRGVTYGKTFSAKCWG